MTDKEIQEAFRSKAPRAPTKDQINALANDLREFRAAFGEAALVGVVKAVLAKKAGAPKSSGTQEENRRLLAQFRAAQDADNAITVHGFGISQEWDEGAYDFKRLARIVKEDDQLVAARAELDEVISAAKDTNSGQLGS